MAKLASLHSTRCISAQFRARLKLHTRAHSRSPITGGQSAPARAQNFQRRRVEVRVAQKVHCQGEARPIRCDSHPTWSRRQRELRGYSGMPLRLFGWVRNASYWGSVGAREGWRFCSSFAQFPWTPGFSQWRGSRMT